MFIEDNQLGIYKISTAMAAAWYVIYRLFNKNNDAANDQSDEVQGYKKKRHTPLSAEIHKIFTTYLSPEPVEENNDPRTPRNRHNLERQLFHAGFKLDVESPSRRLENFKSWACKMTVRENQLIEKKSGKLIVSIEDFPDVIRKAHCDDQTGLHLDLPATIEKIKERFTFGHRNFGMNEATVKEELNKCNHPICKPIFKQYRKAKKMGQADATTSRQSFCQDAHNVHSDMSLTSLTPVTLEERNVESSLSLTSLTPLTMDKSLQPLSIMSSATSAQSSPSLTSLAPVTMGESLKSLSIISSATSAQSSPSLSSLAPVTMGKSLQPLSIISSATNGLSSSSLSSLAPVTMDSSIIVQPPSLTTPLMSTQDLDKAQQVQDVLPPMLQCIPVEDSSEVAIQEEPTPVLADDCEEMAIDEERQELPLADVTSTDMKAIPEENIELTDQFFILSERSAVTECVDEETRKDEEHTEVGSPKEQMAHAEDTRNSSDPEESEHKVFDHKDKLTHRRFLNRKMNGLLCVIQSMRKDIKPAYGGKKRNLEKLKKKIGLGLTVLDAMQFHLLLSEDTIAS